MPAALIKSKWSSGNLYFYQKSSTGDAGVYFGEDDVGVDVTFYGATSTKQMKWDQSGNILVMSGVPLQFKGNLATTAVFDFNGTASYMFDAAATKYGGIVISADAMSQNPETASEDGYIAFLVGASIYEIPVYLRT